MLLINPDTGEIIDANSAACTYYLYSKEQITKMKIKDINTLSPQQVSEEMQNANSEQRNYFIFQHNLANGEIKDVEVYSNPVQIEGQKILFSIVHDVTEQRQIRENIIEEKNKLEAFLAALNDGLTVQDTNFQILYQNDVHREKQGEHIGEFCYQAYQNRTDVCPECLLVKCFDDGGVHRRETSAVTDDGVVIHMEVSASPIRDANDNIVAAVETIRDITARKNLENQLIQTQKMESVGQLAGGVAHDFNNMLSVILGYTNLALERIASEDPLHNDLQEVYTAALRSAAITRQLLAFARKQTISPQVLDLNEIIEGMLKMLRRLIGENIDFSWQPDSGLKPVFMDQSQLDQILANLCVNARDAIGGVGKIIIETEYVRLDENYCASLPGVKPGDFAMLAVSDDGCGMDKATVNKVFEPFFTTKEMGEGTGLGLSTVYGRVKQTNGFITLYSEPGKGTTFKIYLPLYEGEIQESEKLHASEIPQSQGETVLIVEDETSILKLAKKSLLRLGYKVLDADKPSKAVALAEKHEGKINLLITDVIMPDMNGRELAEKLHKLYPNLKVLFMSGYTVSAN
jgi:two-component system cell cycle sensor histidine kinase/response regulator CckA